MNKTTDPVATGAGLCADCRWWLADKYTMASPPQRECRNAQFLHESGWRETGAPADSLTYQHYEGGQIWTGPNFGCVRFEASA